MNSLVRRLSNKSDLEKIQQVLITIYTAGLFNGSSGAQFDGKQYIRGRMKDMIALLELEFDPDGNIEETCARA